MTTDTHIRAAVERAEKRSRGIDPFAVSYPQSSKRRGAAIRSTATPMVTITRAEYLLLLEAAEELRKRMPKARTKGKRS